MKLPTIHSALNPVSPLIISDILFRKDKRIESFLSIPHDKRQDVLRTLTPKVKRDILLHLPTFELVKLLESLSPDEATDALRLLTKHKREVALQSLSHELKDSLSTLLEFDSETAAGVMTLDYIQADINDTIAEVARKFKRHENQTGRPPVIIVTKEGRLRGFLPGHELGFASKEEPIGGYIKKIPAISYAARHDDVVTLFTKHPHGKVVVLNDRDDVVGIIYSDDVLKLIQEQQSMSLYDFAGIRAEEAVTDSARQKVHYRYRWLIINLVTSFIAAFTVSIFEDTLQKYVLLAVLMPIVAGMGGNAATQTLAVMVRGIALKQIELRTAMKTLKNELGAGFINGLINAVLVAGVVVAFSGEYKIAIILAVAMVANLLIAAFFGTLIPLIMQKLGKDPAASATIFITTATDVLGFLIFLGLAALVLA